MENQSVFDIVGIGFGPANIALAVSLEELDSDKSILFLESRTAPDWQPEMLLEGADTQHHPLRDFVTPRNPTSPYGFLSYLKSEGRLFDFLNLGMEFPFRKDYARYIRWVARHFDRWVSYGESVVSISWKNHEAGYYVIETNLGRIILAKSVSFGTGRKPYIPEEFSHLRSPYITHLTRYLSKLSEWKYKAFPKKVLIVGGSQSAIEIILDLSSRFPQLEIDNVMRGFSYRLKDTSPFTEEVFFPEFVDTYFDASKEAKDKIKHSLWTCNYSSADNDVIHQLYNKLYEQKVDGRERLKIHKCKIVDCVEESEEGFSVTLKDELGGEKLVLRPDAIILATGFKNLGPDQSQMRCPELLESVYPYFQKDSLGVIEIDRDYRVGGDFMPPLYLNGLCESTHGFGDAGSFSLLSLRSWKIAKKLVGELSERETAYG